MGSFSSTTTQGEVKNILGDNKGDNNVKFRWTKNWFLIRYQITQYDKNDSIILRLHVLIFTIQCVVYTTRYVWNCIYLLHFLVPTQLTFCLMFTWGRLWNKMSFYSPFSCSFFMWIFPTTGFCVCFLNFVFYHVILFLFFGGLHIISK